MRLAPESAARDSGGSAADPPAQRRFGRLSRLRHAFAFGVADGDAALVAAAGFLVRGGILPLILPGVVLPSVIDIAGRAGVSAISIAGQPTSSLIGVLVLLALGFGLWLVASNLLGAWTDAWMVRSTLGDADERTQARLPSGPPLVLRLVAIRLVCLLPIAIALAWTAARIYSSAYTELLTPSSLATPLPLRVIAGAWDAVALLAITWLAAETLAAVAIRRQILLGRGIWSSLAGAIVQIVRRPFSTGLTLVASTAASLVAMAVAMAGTATAFEWCRIAARNAQPIALKLGFGPFTTTRDFRPVVFVLAVFTLVVVLAVALGLAGIASAWRSAAWTNEVADATAKPN
jgi:hypothetical protein